MKKAKNIFYKALQIFCILIIGCSSKSVPMPMQVYGALRFGPYIISPPMGYWYFQKKYPKSFKPPPFKTIKDYFLVSFFENKKDMLSHKIENGVVIDFSVSKNIYKSTAVQNNLKS